MQVFADFDAIIVRSTEPVNVDGESPSSSASPAMVSALLTWPAASIILTVSGFQWGLGARTLPGRTGSK